MALINSMERVSRNSKVHEEVEITINATLRMYKSNCLNMYSSDDFNA
jgi:hypothetical protein